MKFRLVAVCLALLSACTHRARVRDANPGHDPDLLTAEEFTNVRGSTVYDAVQQLRPAWIMHSRAGAAVQGGPGDVVIYIDGTRYGTGIDGLRTLPLRSVASLRYYSPGGATARFGPGNTLGAIEVFTIPH